jgi:hypothetical protein
MVLPAVGTVVAILVIPPMNGDMMSTYYMIGGTVLSVIAYEVVELGRRRSWFTFCDDPPRNAEQVMQRLRVF